MRCVAAKCRIRATQPQRNGPAPLNAAVPSPQRRRDADPRARVVDVALRVPQPGLVLRLRRGGRVPGPDEDLVLARRQVHGRPPLAPRPAAEVLAQLGLDPRRAAVERDVDAGDVALPARERVAAHLDRPGGDRRAVGGRQHVGVERDDAERHPGARARRRRPRAAAGRRRAGSSPPTARSAPRSARATSRCGRRCSRGRRPAAARRAPARAAPRSSPTRAAPRAGAPCRAGSSRRTAAAASPPGTGPRRRSRRARPPRAARRARSRRRAGRRSTSRCRSRRGPTAPRRGCRGSPRGRRGGCPRTGASP